MKQWTIFLFICLTLVGCQTTRPAIQAEHESRQEVEESLKKVVESISGQEMSDKEMRELQKTIRKDPEAQKSLQSITDSFQGKQGVIHYCPTCGNRYAPHIKICPIDNTPLQVLTP